MELRTLISIHSVLLFLFGAGFLIAPQGLLAMYGTSTNATGALTARVFGISNIQISIIMWVFRKEAGSRIMKLLVVLLFVGSALSFILALRAQLSDLFNLLGWTNTVLYFLFSVGQGYFLLSSIKGEL